jgi:plastocyanin
VDARRLSALLAAAALALAGAGCDAGRDYAQNTADSPHGWGQPLNPGAPAEREGPKVSIKDLEFTPTPLQIAAGQTVTWTNNGPIPVRIIGEGFSSPVIEPNGGYQHRFTRPGTYEYRSSRFEQLRGEIVVTQGRGTTESPSGEVPGGSGR